MKILNDDFSIKVNINDLKRRPIGFVTRGDYSQARSHGMGIGVIAKSNDVAELIKVNNSQESNKA